METPLAPAHLAQTGHTDGTENRVYLAKTSERQRDELFEFLRKESEPLSNLPEIPETNSEDTSVVNSTMMEGRTEKHLHHPNISPIKTPVAEKTNGTHQFESGEKSGFVVSAKKLLTKEKDLVVQCQMVLTAVINLNVRRKDKKLIADDGLGYDPTPKTSTKKTGCAKIISAISTSAEVSKHGQMKKGSASNILKM